MVFRTGCPEPETVDVRPELPAHEVLQTRVTFARGRRALDADMAPCVQFSGDLTGVGTQLSGPWAWQPGCLRPETLDGEHWPHPVLGMSTPL